MNVENRLHKLFVEYPRKSFSRGEVLLRPDEIPEKLYMVFSGRVKQYLITDEGNEVVLHIFSKGAAFPIEQLSRSSKNDYFYEVDTETIIGQISITKAKKLVEADNGLLIDILLRANQQYEDTDRRLINLMTGSAKDKVIFELVRSCQMYGKRRSNGNYFMEIHEEDIANQLGLTRETVSRVIQKIDSTKLVRVTHSGIEISDLDALAGMVRSK